MRLYKRFCKGDSEIRVVFSVAKVRDYFSTKDSLPECFKSYVVYLFRCPSCRTCYVGRTHKHLDTRIQEHLGGESSSIFKHLNENKLCKEKTTKDNAFKNLDSAREASNRIPRYRNTVSFDKYCHTAKYLKWINFRVD